MLLLALFNAGLSFIGPYTITAGDSISSKSLANTICKHLNWMYVIDFIVQLTNLYAYYHVHDISFISHRYKISMISGGISLVSLVLIINEDRYSPSKPIIAETVRAVLFKWYINQN